MNVLSAPALPTGSSAQLTDWVATLPRLSQPSFVASEPFEAYLLSLTDPASEALAAITRGAVYPTPQTPAAAPASAGSVIRGQVAAALLATATGPALGPVSTGNPAPAAAALAAAPGETAAAAAPALLSPAQAPGSGESAAQNPSPSPEPSAEATATAAAAATAATTATTTTTAIAAIQDEPGLAADATAKFMGGGTLGQSMAAPSTDQAVQEVIPAVSEVQSTAPMTANTSTNSRGRTLAQAPAVRQALKAPTPKPGGAGLDLTA
jgi:hypothetical protein